MIFKPNTRATGIITEVWEEDGGNLCRIVPNGYTESIHVNIIGYNNERDKKSLPAIKIIHLKGKEIEFFIHRPLGNETYLVSVAE